MADSPLGDGARERAREARGRANERAKEAREKANERVSDARDRANERAKEAREKANERIDDARQRARDLRAKTKARLFGLDRSGPPPAPTLPGEPWNPWTLPNAIGYIRLGLIPVFLILALSSDNGRDTVATVIFAVIGWSDYLDGFVARLTGQFSRLGALLDPSVDRLLAISGMVVCWRFSLLPHWLLWIVIGREVIVIAITRWALHLGFEMKINWFGRLAVAPVLAAPFFAMAGVHRLAVILLCIGATLAVCALALYLIDGYHFMRARAAAGSAGPSS